MRLFVPVLGLFWLIVSAGCTGSIGTLKEFNEWLNMEENGCVKTRTIAGMNVTVKYLPPSYIALKIAESDRVNYGRLFDSLEQEQHKLVTFLMTLTFDTAGKQTSVMHEGAGDYGGYVQRVLAMNFFMDRYVSLYCGNKLFVTAMTSIDNVYELSSGRSFLVAFVRDENRTFDKKQEYIFIYKDPFFSMGNVQLGFSGRDLQNAMDLKVRPE